MGLLERIANSKTEGRQGRLDFSRFRVIEDIPVPEPVIEPEPIQPQGKPLISRIADFIKEGVAPFDPRGRFDIPEFFGGITEPVPSGELRQAEADRLRGLRERDKITFEEFQEGIAGLGFQPQEDIGVGRLRLDGTRKGKGFKGELKMTDGSGRTATELSATAGLIVNGEDTLFPLIVSTSTKKELDLLLSGIPIEKVPQPIIDKAKKHAKKRIDKGKSPFIEAKAPSGVTRFEAPPFPKTIRRFKPEAVKELTETLDVSLIPITATFTIPINIVLGIRELNPERFKNILRTVTLQPGGQVFMGDVLKSIGVTDESIGLPFGTIDRLGLIGDFALFGGAAKLNKLIAETLRAKNPAEFFAQEFGTVIKSAKAKGLKIPRTAAEKSIRRQEQLLKRNFINPILKTIKSKKELDKATLRAIRKQQKKVAKGEPPTVGVTRPTGRESLAALERQRQGVGKVEPKLARRAEPIIANANRHDSMIRLEFDREGVIPTVDELKKIFSSPASGVEITKFKPGIGQFVGNVETFRIDVFDKLDRLSSIEAEKLFKSVIGKAITKGSKRQQLLRERPELLEKSLGKGIKRLTERELGIKPKITRITQEQLIKEPSKFREVLASPKLHDPETVAFAKRLRSEGGFAQFTRDKIVVQRFRTDKFDISPEGEQKLVAIQKALGLSTRKVRTIGEVEDLALEAGMDVQTLLRQTSSKTRLVTDVQQKALANLLKTNTNFIAKARQQIKTIGGKDPIKIEELEKSIDNAMKQIMNAVGNRIRGGTEAGRAIHAMKLVANDTLDPAFWITRAQRVTSKPFTMEQLGKVIDTITDISKTGTAQDMASYVASLREPSLIDMMVVLWKSGLLTALRTHEANMLGNVSMAALETAKDIPATGLDILISMARMGIGKAGQRTVTIAPRTIIAKMKAFGVTFKGGRLKLTEEGALKKAGTFFAKGTYSDDIFLKYDMPKNIEFKNKYLRAYVNTVMRSLGAEDIIFRELAAMESLEKQAIVIAKNEFIKGLITKAGQKARIRELLSAPTNKMTAQTIDIIEQMASKATTAASRATFQNENLIAGAISASRRFLKRQGKAGEVVAGLTEQPIPFSRTPTNIAARIFDYTPAGLFKIPLAGSRLRPTNSIQEQIVNDFGRAATGTGLIALGYYYGSKGLATGNAPTGTRNRAHFFGKFIPNAMQIAGKLRAFNRFSPAGNLFTLGAEFYRLRSEGKKGIELGTGIVFGAIKTLTEQTFLRGVDSAVKALATPERSLDKYLNMLAGSIVPSIIGSLARSVDPISRIPDSWWQAPFTRLPVLSKRFAARRDNLGNVVFVGGKRLNFIDPFSSKEIKDNPVWNEAQRIGSPIGVPSETVSGIRLTKREFDKYQKIQGMALEQNLTEIMMTEEYQASGTAEQVRAFEKTTRDVRTAINNTIFPAIMFERYNLPVDTDVDTLRNLLSSLSKEIKFNSANTSSQEKMIKRGLKFIATQ